MRWSVPTLFVTAALASCVSTPPTKAPHWDRTGGTREAFAYDRGQCLGRSSAAPVSEFDRLVVFNACMEERGWRRQ
jgi:hypothetical protein